MRRTKPTEQELFLLVLTAFAGGDRRILKQRELLTFNALQFVAAMLNTVETAGACKRCRNKWRSYKHPVLGVISWKSGKEGRRPFFLLRIAGRLAISARPIREISELTVFAIEQRDGRPVNILEFGYLNG